MTHKTVPGPAEARIYELANQHGIVAERLPIDDWADKISELSGDELLPDPVQDLIVTLERKGIINGQQGTEMYGDYLRQISPESFIANKVK